MAVRFGRGIAVAVIGLAVAGVVLPACSSDSPSTASTVPASPGSTPGTSGSTLEPGVAPLRVADIAAAVAAVEAELGGPQEYFEINATPTLVNLFVATEGATKAVAYVYALGKLEDPASPQAASGPTFAADEMTFDADTVLDNVVAKLPDSTLRGFSAVGTAQGGVAYLVTADSSRGGRLEISIDADGTILGVTES